MAILEVPTRIEPARLEEPSEAISDAVAELSARSASLGNRKGNMRRTLPMQSLLIDILTLKHRS